MPAPFFVKASMLFFQQSYGWSETWIYSSPAQNFDTAAAAIRRLVPLRTALMGTNTFINGSRLSLEGVFRDVELVDFKGTGLVGPNGPGINGESAAPATALLDKHNTSVLGAPSAYRPLRGLPRSMVQAGGIFTPTAGWNLAYADYTTQIKKDGWGWMGLATQNKGIVLSVVQTPLGQTATMTLRAPMAPLPPFNIPLMISVSGVQGASQINGRHLMTTVDGVTFITIKKLAVSTYVAGGKALFSVKQFAPDANTGQFLRIDERKPGRPFYLSRGRRRAAVAS